MSGHVVDRCLSPEVGINSFGSFRENDFYGRTEGGTTDANVTTVAQLCSSTKQS